MRGYESLWGHVLARIGLGIASFAFVASDANAAENTQARTASPSIQLSEAECKQTVVTRLDREETQTTERPHFCFGTFRAEIEVVRVCAGYKFDFNKPCMEGGYYPLLVAASNRSVPMMKMLLDAGANIKIRDEAVGSVLHAAVHSCRLEFEKRREDCENTLRFLVSKGVDINATDPHGQSPLWLAIGNETLMEILISLGANQDQYWRFMTPLDYAYEMKYSRTISLLESRRALRGNLFNSIMRRVNRAIDYYSHPHWGS